MKVELIDGRAHLILENDIEIARTIARLASPISGGSADEPFATCIRELDGMIPLVPTQPALFEATPSMEHAAEVELAAAMVERQLPLAPTADHERAFPTNLVEWALGQEAGYRGDDLIGLKSADFMLGYRQGVISKAAYLEMRHDAKRETKA